MLNLLKSDIDKREVDKEGVDEKMELLKISWRTCKLTNQLSFNETVETG